MSGNGISCEVDACQIIAAIQTSCLFELAASHCDRPSSAWVSNVDISVSRIVTLSQKNMQHANVLRKKAPVAGLFLVLLWQRLWHSTSNQRLERHQCEGLKSSEAEPKYIHFANGKGTKTGKANQKGESAFYGRDGR